MVTQKFTNTEYGGFIIKPDATTAGLTEPILQDIERIGLRIEYVKQVDKVTDEQLQVIWRKNKGQEHVFKSLNHCFSLGPAVAVIVSQNGYEKQREDESVHESVTRVKGKVKEFGLRGKYQPYNKEDFEKMGLKGDELLFAVGKTRIHGADSDEEFGLLAEALLDHRDLEHLRVSNPPLCERLKPIITREYETNRIR